MPMAVGVLIPSLAGTLTASVIGGALIGAGIGALTAAFTGGDILKGALFGGIGGAVMGAASFGIGQALASTGTNVGANVGTPVLGAKGQVAAKVATDAGTKGLAEAGKQTFLSKVGGFMTSETGLAFGMQAVSSGIGGIADAYGKKREGEAQEKMLERKHEMDKENMALQHKYNMEAAARSGGGGSSGPDYTIEELMRKDTNAAEQERQTVLAKVAAEMEGQRGLRQMDFAETAAARERASAGATALRGNKRTGSRSEKTMVDTIEDAKGQGDDVNVAVDPGVDYVPKPIPA